MIKSLIESIITGVCITFSIFSATTFFLAVVFWLAGEYDQHQVYAKVGGQDTTFVSSNKPDLKNGTLRIKSVEGNTFYISNVTQCGIINLED